MKRCWFVSRCNEIWSNSGLEMLTGHSFHIGSTTHLLLTGINPFIVMVQGRWKSTAFLEYWHRCEEIIPTFIGFSQASKTSILTSMASFKQWLIGCLWLVLVVSLSGDNCFPKPLGLLYIWWNRLSSQPRMQWEPYIVSLHSNFCLD